MNRLLVAFLPLVVPALARAGDNDWPTYGHGVQRQHSTKHRLAKKLALEWQVQFPAPQPAWPSEPKMHIDMVYEPVLSGKAVYLGLNSIDELVALDLDTGRRRWSFSAGGPIRRPPAVYKGNIYFTSDDGHCYCLDAESGQLRWRYFGGPAERYVLGNSRIISQWAARSGVLLSDGKAYFGSGVWPFMGTFLQCLDADTGKVVWRNTKSSSFYSRHPHGGFGISGLSPQGPIALCGNTLIVSNGRTRPMRLDARTGKRLRFESGWQNGCTNVTGAGDKYFNGAYLFGLKTCTLGYSLTQDRGPRSGQFRPVVEGDLAWSPGEEIRRWHLNSKPMPFLDYDDKLRYDYPYRQFKRHGPLRSEALEKSPACDQVWIKAGGQLFATNGRKLVALNAADGAELWSHTFSADVGSVIAGQAKLLVSTRDGSLHCFGRGAGRPKVVRYLGKPAGKAPTADTAKMRKLLATGSGNDGYCLVVGIDNGGLVKALALESSFYRVVGFDRGPKRIARLRKELVAMGLYGKKVDLVCGDIAGLPPYLMKLICSERDLSAYDPRVVFDKLRPYGGRACFGDVGLAGKLTKLNLPNAKVETRSGCVVLSREGALPGSAPWTHNNGTPGNTMSSEDRAVRGPLGVIWYGGPVGGKHFINRHDGAPRPQVAHGRVLCQKKDLLTCYDAYTGQILWQKEIPGLAGILKQRAHPFTPNAFIFLGGNMVSLPDTVYVEQGSECLLLDPATGKEKRAFRLPEDARWGTIQILGDTLIVLAGTQLNEEWQNPEEKRPEKRTRKFGFGTDPWNGGVHKTLCALDRHTGKLLWRRDAKYAYRSSGLALGNDKVFIIDLAPEPVRKRFRGITSSGDKAELLALDARSGREIWKQADGIRGSWLGYSRQADVLLEVPDGTLHGYGSVMLHGWDGSAGARLYKVPTKRALGVIIAGDRFHSGRAHAIRTGRSLGYYIRRGRGCNAHIGSPNMIAFRTSSSGYSDLSDTRSGLVALPGFRTSCFGSLIPADGMLNAPNEATGCACNYSIYTALALTHMPEMDVWSAASEKARGDRIGINLGAPGDRVSEQGCTFFQYPLTAWRHHLRRSSPLQDKALEKAVGKRRDLVISTIPESPETFQYPSLSLPGERLAWIGGSGMKGLKEVRLEFGRLQLGHGEVRLHFCELEATSAGQRVLDVAINGKNVLKGLDIFREAGGARKVLVKKLEHVDLKDALVIGLEPAPESALKETILCGIELIKQ